MLQASLRTKLARAPESADLSILFQSRRRTTWQPGGPHHKSVGAAQCPTFTQTIDSTPTRSTIVRTARPSASVWMEPPPFLCSIRRNEENCADPVQTHVHTPTTTEAERL